MGLRRWWVALLLCVGCSTSSRVNITLVNKTDKRLELWSMVGIFGRTIILEPGQIERVWVDRHWPINEYRVEFK